MVVVSGCWRVLKGVGERWVNAAKGAHASGIGQGEGEVGGGWWATPWLFDWREVRRGWLMEGVPITRWSGVVMGISEGEESDE